ncbi:hypothetical protein RND71_029697 [Anisodus tanguticus]|uniref:Uncharacterized protein n=1 Tax=Anisodus tanguticus TaxID=243964 RepID=A0AAE1RDU0_9SOLA|nr:hypothetical protein RND71_029697 [Anisodus tanguticus]
MECILNLGIFLVYNAGNSNSSASLLGESRKNIQNQQVDATRRTQRASTDQPDDNETFQKLESEKLLEDTTDFFTMMNKDYT